MFFLEKKISLKKKTFFLILFSTYFLRFYETISFKFVFLFQLLICLILLKNQLKINKNYFFFIILAIFLFFFNVQLKYISYVILVALGSFLYKNKIKFSSIEVDNYIYFILLFLLLLFSTEVSTNKFFLFKIYKHLMNTINDPDYLLSNLDFIYFNRYTFFNLDANYSSVLVLMIYNLFFFNNQKKYFLKYSFFSICILFLTKSKSGLIFYTISIFYYYYRINFKKQIFIFLILNFLFISCSYLFFKNFKDPYFQSEVRRKDQTYKTLTYKEEICNKNFSKKIKFLIECNKSETRSIIILQFLGMSSYLKFYSVGYTLNDIKNNWKSYLLPNSEKKRLINKEIDKFKTNNHLSAHNIVLQSIYHFGLIYFVIFFLNIYLFFRKQENFNLFPALISSIFIGMDTFLFLPIIFLSLTTNEKK